MSQHPLFVERECPNCSEKIEIYPVRLKTCRTLVCPNCGIVFENHFEEIEKMLDDISRILEDLS